MTRASIARRQGGATLLVVLIMLVVLTLFALAAINISNVNMRIVGNMQNRTTAEATAQHAVEQVLSTGNYFYNPASAVSGLATGVTVANRICMGADAATGYSAAQAIVPEDTYWNVQVTVNDTLTGASTVMHQGVRMRMLAGNCPS
jgi:Tfp pilus assembly protein PilX